MDFFTMGGNDALENQRKDPAFTQYAAYNRGYEAGEKIYAKQYALEQMAESKEVEV